MLKTILEFATRKKSIQKTNDVEKEKITPKHCIFKSHKMLKTILEFATRKKSIQKTNDVEKEKITPKHCIIFNYYTYEYVSNSKKYIYIKK